jgi:hypothetical protein
MFVSYLPFKIAPLPSHTFFLLVVSSSLAREFVTSSFVMFCFLLPLSFSSLNLTLAIMLCSLSKTSNLPPKFKRGLLLISPSTISSSLPRVGPDLTPFVIVFVPPALLCLYLLSYTLVRYRLWPLRYLCLLPKCLP